MTEQQREAFEAWYNEEYVRPIIPADRTEGGYQHPDAQAAWDAWQASLSHAEGEAVDLEIGAGDVLICDLGTASAAGVAFYRDNAAHDVGTHHPELSGMGGTELAGRIFSVMTEKPESLVVLYNAVGRALATLGHPAPHAEGEAFGWFTEDHDTDKSATTYDPVVADRWRKKGWPVWPLYTHPAPQVAGLTETAIKSSPAYRALHREKEHLLGLLKDQAPQVAVPEGWEIWTDDHGDLRVSGTAERLPTGRQHRETVWLGPEPETPELWLFRKLCDRLLAAAPTAPAGEPDENDDLVIQADAYRYACEGMEHWQSERAKAGKEIGTEGSLVDGLAWLYAYIDRLERLLTDPRPDGACRHGVHGVHECQQCADDVPAHIARASVERDIAAMKGRQQPVSDPDGLLRLVEDWRWYADNNQHASETHKGRLEIPESEVSWNRAVIFRQCADELEVMLSIHAPDEREIAALWEDAERYRYVRLHLAPRQLTANGLPACVPPHPGTGDTPAWIDSIVDTARLRAGKEGES